MSTGGRFLGAVVGVLALAGRAQATACERDEDCAFFGNQVCDVVAALCADCTPAKAGRCGGTTPVCAAGACVRCTGDHGSGGEAPCLDSSPVCDESGACGRCATSAACRTGTHAGVVCNGATGACGSTCSTDDDCGSDGWCDAAGGAGAGACAAKIATGEELPQEQPFLGLCTSENARRACASGVCDADGRCGLANGAGPCSQSSAAAVCRSGACGGDGRCGRGNGEGPCTHRQAAVVCRSGICGDDGGCGYRDRTGSCTPATAPLVCRGGACDADGSCAGGGPHRYVGGGSTCAAAEGTGPAALVAPGLLALCALWRRRRTGSDRAH